MKTPIQEHIQWLKKEYKKLESMGELGIALHIGDCIQNAESLLEKEKEVMSEIYADELVCYTDGCRNDRDKCSCKNWGGCPVD